MFKTPVNFAEFSKPAFEAGMTAAKTNFDAAERLVALNLNAARASMEDGSAALRALLAVKSPAELAALQTAFVKPAAEKAVAYYRASYEILAQSVEAAVKPFEAKVAELNGAFTAQFEKAAKSAPAGSEAAIAAMRNAIVAANSTFDSVNKATRKVVELTEKNLTASTDAAIKAVATKPAAAKKSA